MQPLGLYFKTAKVPAYGLPVFKYIDFVVAHSMYDMKRAVHKISQTELINSLAHQFFIPHPQGRK